MLATLLTCVLLQTPGLPVRRSMRAMGAVAVDSIVREEAVGAAQARQQAPLSLSVSPDAGKEPVLRVGPVLQDASLEKAARSGLPLRLRFRIELWRDRWIDALVHSESWIAVLVYDPLSQSYLVRAQSDSGPARRFTTYGAAADAAEAARSPAPGPTRPGRYYYTASLRVETLSLSDLEELENWLKGDLGPAVGGKTSLPKALSDGLKRALIRVLGLPARIYDARTHTFTFR